MSEKKRTFSPGDRICIEIAFVYEGQEEIESVEALFCREGSDEEIVLLGDAWKRHSGEERSTLYAARLEGRIDRGATPGDYRCARICSGSVRRRPGLCGRHATGPRRPRGAIPTPARSYGERFRLKGNGCYGWW
jgi:hypothetical protein